MKKADSPRFHEILLLCIVVFGPAAFGCVEPWSKAILQSLSFLLLFFCSLRSSQGFHRPLHSMLISAAVIAGFIFFFQRLNPRPVFAPQTLWPFTDCAYATSQELLSWSAYAAILWAAPEVLASRLALRRCAWAVFLLGIFVTLIGLAQHWQGNTAIYGLREVKAGYPFGPYYNQDHAASLMAMSLLMGFGLFFSSVTFPRQLRVFFLIVVVFFGLFKSGSRGGLNSFVFSALIISFMASAFIGRRSFLWALRLGLVLAGAAYLAFIYLSPEWSDMVHGAAEYSSVSVRRSLYHSGLVLFRDFPLFGVGLGGFKGAFPAYQEPSIGGLVDHVHSDWLEFLLEIGLPGFLFFAAGLILFLGRSVRLWFACPSGEMRCLFGGVLAAVLACLLHASIDFTMHIPANATLFFVLLSWISAADSWIVGTSPENRGKEGPQRPLARIFVAIFCLVLTGFSARPAIAAWYASRAQGIPLAGQPALISQAIKWDLTPRYQYKMAEKYFLLALGQYLDKRPVLLRRALAYCSRALEADPLNRQFQRLESAILWRLGRIEDAQDQAPFLRCSPAMMNESDHGDAAVLEIYYGKHFPSWRDLRFKSYRAIVEGKKGIFYFTSNMPEDQILRDYPEQWQALAKVVGELKSLQPIFEARQPVTLPFMPTPDGVCARAWRYQGRDYVIILNSKVGFYKKIPNELLSFKWRPLFEIRRDPRDSLKFLNKAWYLRPRQVMVFEGPLRWEFIVEALKAMAAKVLK